MAVLLATDELPMSCQVCQKDPAKREVWGCDRPNPDSRFWMDCPVCNEEGKNPRGNKTGCSDCDGRGRVHISTCPRKCVGPEHMTLLQLYSFYEKGMLPEDGPVLEQLNQVLEAFAFVSREYRRVEEREMERHVKEQRRHHQRHQKRGK